MSKTRIKEILFQKNMTMSDLSDKTGLAQENISRICSDTGNPTLETLSKIADALDIRPGDLINEPTGISGFLKVNGVVYEINTKEDLENILKQL